MLNIRNTAFRAIPTQPAINYNYKQPSTPVITPEDMLNTQIEIDKKSAKKEKQRENLEKWGVYGTCSIGAILLVNLLVSLFSKSSSKNAIKNLAKDSIDNMKQEKEFLTGVNLIWDDFKGKKTVAPLNSVTTAEPLQKAFQNIIKSTQLSQKALWWGGGADKKSVDIIYLYGHGGTGKTYVAKQYAQEIGALFTNIKYPDIGSPYKDAASMKISNMFDEIIAQAEKNKNRKIVICIDEIDAVIKKINDLGHGSEEASKSRAAVLTGLDRLREKCSNVTVIATSNYHPKNGIVDEIALRRFNNHIEVPLPNEKQIEGLLTLYLKDVEKIAAVSETEFLKSPEFKMFVKKLHDEGYSNGEIELIAKEAGKSFRSTLDVPDAEITKEKHPFSIKYLYDAMKIKGTAASKTNRLMTVKEPVSTGKGTGTKLSLKQKLILFFDILRNT